MKLFLQSRIKDPMCQISIYPDYNPHAVKLAFLNDYWWRPLKETAEPDLYINIHSWLDRRLNGPTFYIYLKIKKVIFLQNLSQHDYQRENHYIITKSQLRDLLV